MQNQKPPTNRANELLSKKQLLELKMLQDTLSKDKKAVDNFVEEAVPPALIAIVKQLVQDLESQFQEMQKKSAHLSPQNIVEMKQIERLQKTLPTLKGMKYWQLLQLLLQLPTRLKIGIDKELAEYIAKFPVAQELQKRTRIYNYIGSSLHQFLTDVITFWRLRNLQLQEIGNLKGNESPIDKALTLEQEFAIIPHVPHHILLEKRIGGNQYIGIFRGTDLASNLPVIVKYLTQQPEVPLSESQIRSINISEMRRRFEREAQAFSRLEKHRREKEEEMAKLVEQAKKQIEEGKKEGNYEKMRTGFDMLKQGEELLCDRHFLKPYFYAIGQLYRFNVSDKGFQRKNEGENIAFMVTEHLNDSKTLEEWLSDHHDRKTFLPVSSAITILEGILQALGYCHGENIIHRDIRPANILLTKDNKVRLTNLGLARVEDMTQLTAQGAFVGTPGYAAPEGIVQGQQFQKDFEHLIAATDRRFDLYSLGCVAYEMLAGRQPFASSKTTSQEREQELLLKHLQEEPMAPSRFRPEISARLDYIVLKLMAKRPEDRFASAEEALEALRASMSLGQKAGEFTNKIFDKMRPTQPQGIYPVRRRHHLLARISMAGGVALLLLLVSGVAFGPWWNDWLGKGKEWTDQLWRQFSNKAQLAHQRHKIAQIIEELEQARLKFENLWQTNSDLRVSLRKEFPPEEGYPVPSPRVDALLAKSKRDILAMRPLLSEAREKANQDNIGELLQRLLSVRSDPRYTTQIEGLLQRITNQLQGIEDLAKQTREVRRQEEGVRQIARNLRSYLFAMEEKVALIDEKLAVCLERYPKEQGYQQVPAKVMENLQSLREQSGKMQEVVTSVSKAFAEDKLSVARQITQPYEKFSPEAVEQFGDIDESISAVINACTQLSNERARKRTTDRAFIVIQERQEMFKKYLPLAKEAADKLSQTFPGERPSQDILQKAQQENKRLQTLNTQLSQYLQENKESQAMALADSLLKETGANVAGELRIFHERALDRIKIARAAGQEKQYKKETSDLLALTKNNLSAVDSAYSVWQQEIAIMRQEFPQHSALSGDRNGKVSESTGKAQKGLAGLITAAEQKIGQADVPGAYQLLSQNKERIAATEKLAQRLKQESSRLHDLLLKSRGEQQSQVNLARGQRILQKLEKYAEIMSDQATPLQKEIASLERDFPLAMRYPQISSRSREIMETAQKWISLYKREVQKGKELLGVQKTAQALALLEPYENKGLGYPQFSRDVREVQEDVAKVRREGSRLKVHQEKIVKINGFLRELTTREQNLQAAVNTVATTLQQIQGYASQPGFVRPDANVDKYVEEARLEIGQLQSLMSDGKQMLDQGKYPEAITVLEPYSESVNPTISRLPMMRSYSELLRKNLQHNEQIANNPKMRADMVRRQQEEQERRRRIQQWQTSPGPWYDELVQVKQQFDNLRTDIEKSLQEKGSSLVYARINSGWRKIAEYPEQMAELRELLEIIEQKKVKLPQEATNSREKQMLQYVASRQIAVTITLQLAELKQCLQKLNREIQGGAWVEEETLRSLLRMLEEIVRAFEEEYIPVKSDLINRANS
jgi:serine/threonine protein kinase